GGIVPIGSNPQRVAPKGAVAYAGIPPVGRAVDDGESTGQGLVGFAEVGSPLTQLGLGHVVARVAEIEAVDGPARVGVVLNVKHRRKSVAVGRPAPSIRYEVPGLVCSG